MAKSDVLVRMKADVSNYDANIAKARRQLDGFKKDNLSMGGIMKQSSSALLSVAAKYASFGAAVSAAMKVTKDAFMASEASVDKWGQTMKAAGSLYDGFLTSINTGDISGYLSRINQIVEAAREAYNEMDRLGTMKTIQAPQVSAQQTENERMRMMIQTGRYIAPTDGRRASMQNGQLLNADQIRRIEQQLNGGMQKVVSLVGNEVKQTGKAIDALYKSQAVDLGLSLKEFRKGTSSMAEFDKRMEGYEKYKAFEAAHTTTPTSPGVAGAVVRQQRDNVANPYADFAQWGVFRVDGDRYQQIVQLIQQRDQQAAQSYSMQAQAYRTMNRAEGITVSKIMGGGGTSSGGGRLGAGGATDTFAADSIAAQEKRVQELTKLWREASAEVRDGYKVELTEAQRILKEMQEPAQPIAKLTDQDIANVGAADIASKPNTMITGLDTLPQILSPLQQMNEELERMKELLEYAPDTQAYQDALQKIAEKENEIAEFKGEGKKINKAWDEAAQGIGAVGQALASIDDPATKIMGTVAMAIANVAQAASQAIAAKDTTASGWAWIGAAAAITATMISTIASIHSATGYAQGGIVDGNSYSGDNIPIMANAGEVVLTKAMTSNLANFIENSRGANGGLTARASGEQIYLVLNNYLRRSGKGELVTWG